MNRNISSIIKSEYERRQKLAMDAQQKRKEEVYGRMPRVQEIDEQIQSIGLKYNKAILLGTKPADRALHEMKTEDDRLNAEKEALLTAAGYPSNYLELMYKCQECKDTGYVIDSGIAKKCPCYKQLMINLLYDQFNLRLTETENFSFFNESFYPDTVDGGKYGLRISPRENILNIKERCLSFIEDFESPDEKNLYFCGPTGVGKTFMSNCIAKEILMKGNTVLYQTAPALFNTISEYRMKSFKDEEFQDTDYNNILDVDLLIIDDLGTEPPSAARFTELLTILNTRQTSNLARPCKTIISTNIGAEGLYEYYKERVASRIIGCFDICKLAGEDIRSIKKFSSK